DGIRGGHVTGVQTCALPIFLLELALAANRQEVVLHTNVQILRIDFRQIGLYHQFMLGLVNVHRRCPGSEAGFLARPLEDIIEQPIHLVLQGSSPAERFPLGKCSHFACTSKSDCRRIIKYECIHVKYKIHFSLVCVSHYFLTSYGQSSLTKASVLPTPCCGK